MATLTEDFNPVEIAQQIAESLHRLSREETSSELVYSPLSRHSYYRDFLNRELGRATPDAGERLKRHAEQMDRYKAAREARAWGLLRGSGLEYRVTPDRTDGYGGYFAPPAWLNQLFATANRPGRTYAGLIPRFPLPSGVSSVNVPVISTGTVAQPANDDNAAMDQDILDSSALSGVVPLAGQADVALQLLEQSPAGAHVDWAIFQDLSEAFSYDLESQLIYGTNGSATNASTVQLPGVLGITGIVNVPYTTNSPTGSGLWIPLSKVAAQIGDARLRPPECWMMRTARWAWFQGAEDTGTRPFGLSTRFYIGNDDDTPDPISGLMGWPVFLNDAIPATFSGSSLVPGGGSQDVILCLRPRDQILLEGEPQTMVAREPLSGSLGVRIQMHCNVAAITGRRPAGVGVLQGTGMGVVSGY